MDFATDLVPLLASTMRTATPLILAAFAGLFSERAGVVDIGLEGKMLFAAFAAGAAATSFQSVWAGLMAAMLASTVLALVHGFVTISQRGNQIVSGMAINILAAGLAPTLASSWYHKGGQTPFLIDDYRFSSISLPGAEWLRDVSVVGPVYSDLLSGHHLLTYMLILLVPGLAYALYRTRWGLRLRAVGENPEAVDTAGLSVYRLRYHAVMVTGMLCGVAGAVMSTAQGNGFIRDMSAGQGYLALAALIFGRWRPYPTMGACLLFGFVSALEGRLQGVDLPLVGVIPSQFTMMLPYVLTLVILAGFVGRMEPPKASGIAYEKDR